MRDTEHESGTEKKMYHRRNESRESVSSSSSGTSSGSTSSTSSTSRKERSEHQRKLAKRRERAMLREVQKTHRVVSPLNCDGGSGSAALDTNRYQAIEEGSGRLCAVWISTKSDRKETRHLLGAYEAMVKYRHHKGLPQARGLRETDKYVVLWWDYCANGSVHSLLEKTTGGLSERKTLEYLREVLSVLVFLHDNDDAHGNVTVKNMRLSIKGNVKLHGMCKYNMFTDVDYNPPELIVDRELHSAKAADLWSLGISFFVMLAGALRFSNAKILKFDSDSSLMADTSALMNHSKVQRLSRTSQMLFHGLLHIDPDERLNSRQALSLCNLALSRLSS